MSRRTKVRESGKALTATAVGTTQTSNRAHIVSSREGKGIAGSDDTTISHLLSYLASRLSKICEPM